MAPKKKTPPKTQQKRRAPAAKAAPKKRSAPKISGLRRLARDVGVFPVNPTRLAQTAGVLNGVSSVVLGRDLENDFKGQTLAGPANLALARTGAGPIDIPSLLANRPSTEKFLVTLGRIGRAYAANVRGTMTPLGAKRAILPAAAGIALHQAAKASRARMALPASLRRYVTVG